MRGGVIIAMLAATWSSSSSARSTYVTFVTFVPSGSVSSCQTCHANRRTATSNPGNAASTSTYPDGVDVSEGEGESEEGVVDEPAEAPADNCGNSSVAGIAPLLMVSRRWRRPRDGGASSWAARR